MKLVTVSNHIGIFGSSEKKVWDDIHISDRYSIVAAVAEKVWAQQITDLKECINADLKLYIFKKMSYNKFI